MKNFKIIMTIAAILLFAATSCDEDRVTEPVVLESYTHTQCDTENISTTAVDTVLMRVTQEGAIIYSIDYEQRAIVTSLNTNNYALFSWGAAVISVISIMVLFVIIAVTAMNSFD